MKYLFPIFLLILTSCASHSDIKGIKYLLDKENNERVILENKIQLLELEKERVRKKLVFLENSGNTTSSEAESLRVDIRNIDAAIRNYSDKIVLIEARIDKNEKELDGILNDKERYREEIRRALDENDALKRQTIEVIQELEEKYDEERKKATENEFKG